MSEFRPDSPGSIAVGLTGQMGSGKSTVAAQLAARGAVVLESDKYAREALGPGQPAVAELAELLGDWFLAADGTVDRARLAARAFSDASVLSTLEAVVHPIVRARMAGALAQARQGRDLIVADIPLLVETGAAQDLGLDLVVVVDAPREVAIERLLASRSMTRAEIEARLDVQADPEVRRAAADFVLDNSGPLKSLDGEIDRLWAYLGAVRAARMGGSRDH